MNSRFAAFRYIVLPWGATSGPRIVIDAINGEMVFYDANDVPVIKLGPDNGEQTIAVQDAIGNWIKMYVDTGFFNRPVLEFAAITAGGLGIVSHITADSVGTGALDSYTELRLQNNSLDTNSSLYVRSGTGDGVTQRAEIAVDQPLTVDGETWHAITFNGPAGWANLGGLWQTAQYRKEPVEKTVRLRGVVLGGTKTDATVIATLPVGYRPAAQEIFSVGNGTAGGVLPNLRVFPSGQLQIFGMAASTNGTHSWSGITFDAA